MTPDVTVPDVTVPVVVVAASRVERRFLRSAIDGATGAGVIGEAATARDALALIERLRPAAVVLDLDLPGEDAIEVVERLMATVPTPILVLSSEGDAVRAAQALAAGAVDVVARPASLEADPASYAAAVQRGVRVAVRVRVIAHPRARLKSREPATLARLGSTSPFACDARTGRVDVVAIGASTGGPQALAHVLGALPADFGAAVIVVQHMADGFMDGMAGWLDGLAALPVRIAAAGARLQPGTVTVAPSARNLIVREGLRVAIETPPTTQFHVPGVDATFESVARNVGARAVGVLLTGMGRDGACGLKAMRDAGAVTIGQDEESSAVWGMPAAAVAEGAVQHTLPLSGIAEALVSMVATAGGRR
jgi:two-component system chemotaxis response regulator CheB